MPGGTHDRGASARLRAAAGPARATEPARSVVAAAPYSPAAAPDRIPADATPVRHRTARGDAAAHAVVAHAAALTARRAGDHRRRGAVVESAGCDLEQQGTARALDRRRLSRRTHVGRAHAHGGGPDRARGGGS